MKHISLLVLILFTAGALAAYDDSWYQSESWSGEYPSGIAVVSPNNAFIPARSVMDKDMPVTIECELPYKAVYHPWNQARAARYFTAATIVPMTANEALTLGFEGEEQAEVAVGETMEYLIYGAEGMFLVRFKGKEYWADQSLLKKVTYDAAKLEIPQDEWLNVDCLSGDNVWIYMNEIITADQDGNAVYPEGTESWWKGFREYGVVTDLTDDDLKP